MKGLFFFSLFVSSLNPFLISDASGLISIQIKDELCPLSEASWDLAVLRARDSSQLRFVVLIILFFLCFALLFMFLQVEKPAVPVLKKQTSRWGTLKKGLSTLRSKEDKETVEIEWCDCWFFLGYLFDFFPFFFFLKVSALWSKKG